jgi:nicotinate-nucleotide adenylyltransferase
VIKLPPFGKGQRIGLFGGSFNPAHAGHRMVALYALKRLQLDWVWWLVSPQNPLKDTKETGEYSGRVAFTKQIANHPKFIVTDLEKQIHSRNTAQTLSTMQSAFSQAHFIWIMGADSFRDFDRWKRWSHIAETLPLAVLARPGYSMRALGSQAANRYSKFRVRNEKAGLLAKTKAPAWVFVSMPLRKESSTSIRKTEKKLDQSE